MLHVFYLLCNVKIPAWNCFYIAFSRWTILQSGWSMPRQTKLGELFSLILSMNNVVPTQFKHQMKTYCSPWSVVVGVVVIQKPCPLLVFRSQITWDFFTFRNSSNSNNHVNQLQGNSSNGNNTKTPTPVTMSPTSTTSTTAASPADSSDTSPTTSGVNPVLNPGLLAAKYLGQKRHSLTSVGQKLSLSVQQQQHRHSVELSGESSYCYDGLIRQNLCGTGTGTGTDTMPKYRTHLRSHISCSVTV